MDSPPKTEFTHHYATASDGARLSYYTIGNGPSLLILHGSASFALTCSELALELSPYYTVHLVSRRGRGLSDDYPDSVTSSGVSFTSDSSEPKSDHVVKIGTKSYDRTYSTEFTAAVLETELKDLDTLLTATNANFLLAISSGALIALHALLHPSSVPSLTQLRKLTIFEPPLFFSDHDSSIDLSGLPRFERETTAGDSMGALITAMYMVQLGPTWIPRFIMKFLATFIVKAQEKEVEKRKKQGEDWGACTMKDLASVARYDFAMVEGMVGESSKFGSIVVGEGSGIDVLLLTGQRSPSYLKEATHVLEQVIKGAKKIEVGDVGHELLVNKEMRGQPKKAVGTLAEFFK